MKYQINTCIQCGSEFKRTNARHIYCSVACRVSAHRDRHGYEQPIFTYPSIRAVEALKALDIDALYRISLYAILYLDGLEKTGDVLPPSKMTMDMQRTLAQLRIERGNDKAMKQILHITEPMSELLQLVKQIKGDTPPPLSEAS
jgi:hypothetical protein